MWVVMMFTKAGEQYEYTVIPESPNVTSDDIVTMAMQSHVLNMFSGIVEVRADGGHQLTEIIVMMSLKMPPTLPAFVA